LLVTSNFQQLSNIGLISSITSISAQYQIHDAVTF
jgi:hypothetical protein